MPSKTTQRLNQALGSITHFEHVNFRVPDHFNATLFFIEGLGLTRDPTRMVSVRNMWVNVGLQQFHLPIGDAHDFPGEVGLIVPDRARTERALATITPTLKGTKFGYKTSKKDIVVRSPWGHTFRVQDQKTAGSRLPQAVPYVRLWVPPNTAKGIARFYEKYLEVPVQVNKTRAGTEAVVNVGVGQKFRFAERKGARVVEHINHVAVYTTRYDDIYQRMQKAKLIMAPDRAEQFRFCKIVDPKTNKLLLKLEHEVRSLYHPDYRKPLVNRVPVPYLVD